MTIRRTWCAAVLIAVTVSVGCAAMMVQPQTTPKPVAAEHLQLEGKVAYYGREVIGLADTVLTATEQITDQRLAVATDDAHKERIKADARAVITVIKQVGTYGQQLAAALQMVDQAKTQADRKQWLDAARTLITSINRLVAGGAAVEDGTTRATVSRIFGNLSDVLMHLALALPRAG